MEKIYLTTPIYYVNDVPHIGHAYCTLATDVLARFWRKNIGAENVRFLTGTDEHSIKTVQAAEKAGKSVEVYLEEMANNWRTTWENIGVSFDDFIRTSEDRHKKVVQEIFQKIYDNGDIYEGVYKGLYCSGCEAFLKTTDLNEKGECPHHKKPPEKLEEKNYFFRLSKYTKPLLELFRKNPQFLEPESRRKEILSFINSGLDDVSVSRETAEIGIPLPIDPSQKVYVWFDALINYFSAIKNTPHELFWPYANHIIGKDITRFHAVIWPAMLMSVGIEPPQQVFGHGFFTIDGEKMSKSLGNVVSPVELAQQFGKDTVRLGLLSSFEFGSDGDFSLSDITQFHNDKLANGIGNIFYRVLVLCHKFLGGAKPIVLQSKRNEHWKNFSALMQEKKIKSAIDYFFQVMDQTNELMNKTEVWKLVKTDPEAAKKIFAELVDALETLVDISQVLLPESAPTLRKMIGEGSELGEPKILFERI